MCLNKYVTVNAFTLIYPNTTDSQREVKLEFARKQNVVCVRKEYICPGKKNVSYATIRFTHLWAYYIYEI